MKAYEIIILFFIFLIVVTVVIVIKEEVFKRMGNTHSRIQREARKKDLVSDHNKRLTGLKENFYWEDGSDDSGIHNKIKKRLEDKY